MTRDDVEALVAKERPGWRLVDFVEISDESGSSIEVVIESGGQRATLVLGPGKRIITERR
jgi:hypothetical protein